MAEGYGMTLDDVKSMEFDAHVTNFAENKEFFLNANSPSNFERTWKNITFVYKELGLLGTPVRFDEVMDFSVLKKLETQGKFSDEKDEYSRSSYHPLIKKCRLRNRSLPRRSGSTFIPIQRIFMSPSMTNWVHR